MHLCLATKAMLTFGMMAGICFYADLILPYVPITFFAKMPKGKGKKGNKKVVVEAPPAIVPAEEVGTSFPRCDDASPNRLLSCEEPAKKKNPPANSNVALCLSWVASVGHT